MRKAKADTRNQKKEGKREERKSESEKGRDKEKVPLSGRQD